MFPKLPDLDIIPLSGIMSSYARSRAARLTIAGSTAYRAQSYTQGA